MKKIIITFSALFLTLGMLTAQILNPVKWSFESKKISDTEYDLIATAKLDKNWNIYTQNINSDDGPIPTKFTFKPSPQYQLVGGKPSEVSDHKKSGYDKIFAMDVTKYSESVKFIQRIKLLGAGAQISGSVEFGTCDDEKCLPPQEENFNYNISSGAGTSRGATNTPVATPATPTTPSSVIQPIPIQPNVGSKSGGIKDKADWTFESKKISDTEYDLIFKAKIEKGWHIYSQFLKGEGALPTSFSFDKSSGIELIGKAKEESPKRQEHKEPIFDNMTVVDFSESATFTQKIKVKDISKPIKGTLEYMACTEGQCTPPIEVPFSFNLATGQGSAIVETATPLNNDTSHTAALGNIGVKPTDFQFDKTNESFVCGSTTTISAADDSLWLIFIKGFVAGLLAVLMPCIFPLIPMTVGFFTKGSKDRKTGIRNALIYCASIIVIFVSLGLFFSVVFGSDSLNKFATHPVVNIAFGALFVLFALSFFGLFEITLPSGLLNKVDSAADRGGLIGIFFMAFTLVLVSFSCTGPLIGSVLVDTMKYGVSAGAVVCMFGFSLAMALPFGFFAAFPAWLKTLPKSGSWMDDLKVSLGFIEIALAIKFLSNADLIKGWKILPYEAFLGIWILCALGLGLYFAGILKLKKNAPPVKWTALRGGIVAICFAIVFYMGLGYRYNPVTQTFKTPELGSGILPPAGYSYIYPQDCPLNLNCFHDLNEGIAFAKKVNKPILLDFTGYNCANCRKMEENVWNQTGVLELIRDKYVLVSLYTDSKQELKTPYAPYTSSFDNKLKDTEGEMWTDLEATFFNKNSQPFYVLLSPNLKVLNAPVAYTPEIREYQDFLQCGLDKYSEGIKLLGSNF